jgi:glycosyltransferase involved in cell wall biosynthesis
MKSFLRVPGIRFEGRVESTAPYYDRALASIAPVFFGSGTRVKIIESAMNRCPSVSTAIGAEGVGLEPGFSYFRAESAGDWVRSLATLSPEAAETVGERAYEYASRTYDSRKVAAQFHDHVFPSFGLATGSELGYF